MAYEVQIDSFQGPLELLYQLVKKNEIEINKISLAKITGQYLDYMEQLQKFNLETASEFMVIASELIELKAGKILPEDDKNEEDDDNKNDLVQRLKEYQLFKKVSGLLKKRGKTAGEFFEHPVKFDYEPQLELNLEPSQLENAFYQAYQSTSENKDSEEEEMEYIDSEKIKVEDKINEIVGLIQQYSSEFTFERLLKNKNNQMEIVVTLLSILELIKLSKITVQQDRLFTQIKIKPRIEKTEQVV